MENKRRENFLFRETLSVKLERGALGPCSALAETPMRKAKGMRRANRISAEILGSFIRAEAELLVLLRFHASCGLTAVGSPIASDAETKENKVDVSTGSLGRRRSIAGMSEILVIRNA